MANRAGVIAFQYPKDRVPQGRILPLAPAGMRLRVLDEADFPALNSARSLAGGPGPPLSLADFTAAYRDSFAWAVLNKDGNPVGCVGFTHVDPGHQAVLHAFVLPEYQGHWLSRPVIQRVMDSAFNGLGVRRLSSFAIVGQTDTAGETLARLGFRVEGVMREAYMTESGNADVKLYGMLRNECRWLKKEASEK